MGIIDRLTFLARADAHGVVDALEDRALVLRQHLREARTELDRKRSRLEALGAEDEGLGAAAQAAEERLGTTEKDVELALGNGEDDLARFAARRLLGERRTLEEIARRRGAIARERAELEARLGEQEAEYRQLEARVRGYLAERDRSGELFAAEPVTDEDVELELLRRRATEGGV